MSAGRVDQQQAAVGHHGAVVAHHVHVRFDGAQQAAVDGQCGLRHAIDDGQGDEAVCRPLMMSR